jgi:hypothetical protein
MRSAAVLCSFVLLLLAPSIHASNDFSSFYSPLENTFFDSEPDSLNFVKRQNNCQSSDVSCSKLGASDACCPANTTCQPDEAGNVACCPINASCTGTISGAPTTATGSSSSIFLGGGTTSPTNSGLTSSSSSFFFGSTVVTTTTTSANVITTGTTVPNAPYPFYVIPTTFSLASQCSSYASGCAAQFTSCIIALGGGVNGVTVSGAGVGVSVNGITATAAAASICSSLSAAACFGLQLGNCATFPGATATAGATNNGNSFVASPGAAPTRCPGAFYEIGMGFAVGVAGALI